MPSPRSFIPLTLLTIVILCLAAPLGVSAQDGSIRAPSLGINHISAPDDPIPSQRYANALTLGAGWNRWPLYWNEVETTPGGFNWSSYDQLAANDVRYGLHTDAILLGIPEHQREAGRMRGIYDPIFADGTDIPGSAPPNPNNPYAVFVYQAVMRYKPGGELAAQLGWQPTQGIRVWEAWNEPDLRMFWSGSVQDYARLLKVTYMAVRLADPLAQVVFAGLAYNDPNWNDYLAQTLGYVSRDPDRERFGWFFDIAAVHTYTSPERSWQMVRRIKEVLTAYGLVRPVWLNESGVPVWDDYPGPTWTAASPSGRALRATQQEQAQYVITSTALAWAAGAERVFLFQLYDDCGNQPSGTNFAPESGQAGDAYGMFRNDRSAACYTQSLQPNTPRPAASAYYRMAHIFGSRLFSGGVRVSLNGRGTALAFDLTPAQGSVQSGPVTSGNSSTVSERAYVMWNDSRDRLTIEIPANGTSAILYDMGTDQYALTPQDGKYVIGLPPVDAADYPLLTSSEVNRISGRPFILVEQITPGVTLTNPNAVRVQGADVPLSEIVALPTEPPAQQEVAVPSPVPTAIPQPTTDPAFDTTPPLPVMAPLPVVSSPTFAVEWSGLDNSGIAGYIIWVRVNGGAWEKWLETTGLRADYNGAPGNTYEFAAWVVDLAGNWSQNIELVPQAVTSVP